MQHKTEKSYTFHDQFGIAIHIGKSYFFKFSLPVGNLEAKRSGWLLLRARGGELGLLTEPSGVRMLCDKVRGMIVRKLPKLRGGAGDPVLLPPASWSKLFGKGQKPTPFGGVTSGQGYSWQKSGGSDKSNGVRPILLDTPRKTGIRTLQRSSVNNKNIVATTY